MVYTTFTFVSTSLKYIQKNEIKEIFHFFKTGWKKEEFCLNENLVMKRRLGVTVNICRQRFDKVIAIV